MTYEEQQAAATKLSEALRQFPELEGLAERAEKLEYSDFSSPLVAPKVQLVGDLENARSIVNDDMALDDLIEDVKTGKFDG